MPRILPDYPTPPGNKNLSIALITGPASYTQVTNGTPATGGQLVTAADFGLVSIESVFSQGMSDNGQYAVQAIHSPNPAYGTPSVRLRWLTAATGAEVAGAVNLSGRTVRLAAVGL